MRIIRENGDSPPVALARTYGSLIANSYRYYLGDVRFFRTEYGPSEHYQRLQKGRDGHYRTTVTAPSCPVTNDPLPRYVLCTVSCVAVRRY